MSYDFEFDFDSFGNVIKNDVDLTDIELEDTFDPYFDEEDYDDGTQFYEDQLRDYEHELHSRIANNEPIYASEIGMYSDLFKDTFGIRPHGLMSWLTEYDNVIDDYAEIRAKIEANRK